jgi:hypothetical protein
VPRRCVALMTPLNSEIRPASGQLTANFFFAFNIHHRKRKRLVYAHAENEFLGNMGFLAVSSGFGDQVSVVPAWRVDEGGDVSLAA